LVFYTLDLVVLAKNLKKFSGALFDIFGVKVEKFKNYLNELQKFPTRYYLICDCGQRQTMNHTVDTCPLTKFDAAVNLLHEADDDAVIWLESTATAALAKYYCDISKLVRVYFYTAYKSRNALRASAARS